MAYVYKYIPAGQPIQKPANQSMKDDFQEVVREYFYESTNWYTITEETSVGSESFQDIDVRISSVINPTTGDIVEEDYKKLTFININHSVDMGKLYYFENNYWITVNVDKINTLAQTAMIKRCNNMLRWVDEETGGLFEVPCSLSYLLKENRDYATAGSAIVTPSGMNDCFYQINSKTNRIKPNQRFLFGNSTSFTAYRVEGGGINNVNNQQTINNNSASLGRFSLSVDYSNVSTDDTVNLIANRYDNNYTLVLNETSISGAIAQTVQLSAIIELNGTVVSRNLIWSSSNISVATVNSSGLVTFAAGGSATITCSMENNSSVNDTCGSTTVGSPADTYQVIFSPTSNYVLEGKEQTWSIYLYRNNIVQPDAFVFTLNANTVPSNHYEFTVLGINSFKIKNIEKFLTDYMTIQCVSGIYNRTISINLKGSW